MDLMESNGGWGVTIAIAIDASSVNTSNDVVAVAVTQCERTLMANRKSCNLHSVS